MVTKGIPWDELPDKHKACGKPIDMPAAAIPVEEPEERNVMNDVKGIAKRVAFGGVCGSITGATFGFVDVLRDSKAMSQNPRVATARIMQYTGKFGGFFASYHGLRKVLKLYYPQSAEMNVLMATGISVVPLIVMPSLRPMIPYAIMLIGLDAINGINDI